MTNIFREAKQLLDKRDAGGELSWEELRLIGTAIIPLTMRGCPLPEEMAVRDCLETLAQIVEEEANSREKSNTIERAKVIEKPSERERAIG